jgi:phosphoglycolate phosphatase
LSDIFKGIRAVLFDLDGTLVETNIDFPLMKREMISLGERYGIPADETQGLDILRIVDLIVTRLREQSREHESRHVRQEAYQKLEEIELDYCRSAHPIASSVELLDALRDAGIKIGIVTRNSRAGVAISMERCGIMADALVTRDDVENTKPHPDHILRALDSLGVSPSEAVVVGDHRMDVLGGKSAGTRTIGFLRPDRPDDFFDREKPDLIIRDLAELLDEIERLKK